MRFDVEYTEKAKKSIRKLDNSVRMMIKAWIEKNLVGIDDPKKHGKGLSSSLSGYWRYRVGDYRILAEIQEHRLVILVIEVGHRRDIYK